MELSQILKLDCPDSEKIEGILCQLTDYGGENGGMVSVKRFPKVAEWILAWHKQALEDETKHQDRIIGRLTRRVENLEDTESRRQQWLSKAKQNAGHEDKTSFDIVWKEVLEKSNKLDTQKEQMIWFVKWILDKGYYHYDTTMNGNCIYYSEYDSSSGTIHELFEIFIKETSK